jgi:hypothetical protein
MKWNAGGWFGGQLGGTVWMLLAALSLVAHSWPTALGALACFALPNAVGTWLWMRREELDVYRASQGLVAVSGLSALLAALLFDRTNTLAELSYGGRAIRPYELYLAVLATFSLVHLQLWLTFGRRRGD